LAKIKEKRGLFWGVDECWVGVYSSLSPFNFFCFRFFDNQKLVSKLF